MEMDILTQIHLGLSLMVLMYSLMTLHNGLIPILMATAMTQMAI